VRSIEPAEALHRAPDGSGYRPEIPARRRCGRRRSGAGRLTRILTDGQLADYQPWSGNHKRLREFLTELEELSLAIAENDPRWNR
jgi:hypothetical protein